MRTTLLKRCAFILLLAVSGTGCEHEETISACGVKDPIENLEWLRDLKNNSEGNAEISSAEIVLYKWNDKDYIYFQKTINLAQDFPNSIFDCSGNLQFQCGGNQPVDNCSVFFAEAEKIATLWQK